MWCREIKEMNGGWLVKIWNGFDGSDREFVCANWPEVLILLSDKAHEYEWAAHMIGLISPRGPIRGLAA